MNFQIQPPPDDIILSETGNLEKGLNDFGENRKFFFFEEDKCWSQCEKTKLNLTFNQKLNTKDEEYE